jgi:hypothetical protein
MTATICGSAGLADRTKVMNECFEVNESRNSHLCAVGTDLNVTDRFLGTVRRLTNRLHHQPIYARRHSGRFSLEQDMTKETKEGGSNACEFYEAERPTELVRSHAYGYGGGYAKLADYTTEPTPPEANGAEIKKEYPTT